MHCVNVTTHKKKSDTVNTCPRILFPTLNTHTKKPINGQNFSAEKHGDLWVTFLFGRGGGLFLSIILSGGEHRVPRTTSPLINKLHNVTKTCNAKRHQQRCVIKAPYACPHVDTSSNHHTWQVLHMSYACTCRFDRRTDHTGQ